MSQKPKMFAQTPSSLARFAKCPANYHATYILKSVPYVETKYTKFGNQVHKAIEDYLVGTSNQLPPTIAAIQPVLDNMKPLVVGVEAKIAIDKLGNPVAWGNKSAVQRCISDAILQSPDKRTVICIDWKSGKKWDAQIQHDINKKCVLAHYPEADTVITWFAYLFKNTQDVQRYTGVEPLTALDEAYNALAVAYAKNDFSQGCDNRWCETCN